MDNASKAITMSINAILFMIALSIALTSYINIISFLDSILETSGRHANDVENQILDSASIIEIQYGSYYV